MNRILPLFALFVCLNVHAQTKSKYWLYLNPLESIHSNHIALSEYSISNKVKKGVPLDQHDYSLSTNYKKQLNQLGIKVVYVSRWLGAICIETEKPVDQLQSLAFVQSIERHKTLVLNDKVLSSKKAKISSHNRSSSKYGIAENQIQMLNGVSLHDQGYKGEGITIGVFDNGFAGADTIDALDSLINDGRVKAVYDFVNDNDQVYDDGDHGTMVLSTMASNYPDSIIGTAPNANYYLFVTEDTYSESQVEEVNWLKAIEYADSLGVDVTNTSLGYTEFDNPKENYTYEDMDGNTTIITKAADMAAKKGILVVSSAGNSGNDPWYYISAPADGDSVLAIGAVNYFGEIVSFSSRGPSYDGRVKPNVCAQGAYSAVVRPNNQLTYSNGTSFSGPILAGMAACLMQANPEKTNMDLFKAIEKSSHQFDNPDHHYGYGIPNFIMADSLLKADTLVSHSKFYKAQVLPTPFVSDFTIYLVTDFDQTVDINVYDVNGRNVFSKQAYFRSGRNSYHIKNSVIWSEGIYFIKVQNNTINHSFKTMKL